MAVPLMMQILSRLVCLVHSSSACLFVCVSYFCEKRMEDNSEAIYDLSGKCKRTEIDRCACHMDGVSLVGLAVASGKQSRVPTQVSSFLFVALVCHRAKPVGTLARLLARQCDRLATQRTRHICEPVALIDRTRQVERLNSRGRFFQLPNDRFRVGRKTAMAREHLDQ